MEQNFFYSTTRGVHATQSTTAARRRSIDVKVIKMRMTNCMRQITAWIACFAIMLSALAPSISRAVAANNGLPSASLEICTVVGPKSIAVDAKNTAASILPSTPAKDTAHGEPCPFCGTHAGSSALLPGSDNFVFPVMSGEPRPHPHLFYQSPRPLFIWAPAQPRAPPFIS